MLRNNRIGRICGVTALVITVLVVALHQAGCLNPVQREAFAKAMTNKELALDKIAGYDKEIAATLRMIEEKKYNQEEGRKILDRIKTDKEAWKQILKANIASIKEIREAESPWWVYLLLGLQTVAGVGGAAVGGKAGRALSVANTCLGAVSRGIVAGGSPGNVTHAIGIEADKVGVRNRLEGVKEKAAMKEI